MNLFKKIFSSSGSKQKSSAIAVYLDADLKKSIETKDQTVKQYIHENNFDQDQFLYLMILHKKTGQLILKRKLNIFQRFSQCLQSPSQQTKCYIIVGYGSERSTVPRISSQVSSLESMKFIRAGTLSKYNETKNSFEECQLKLHHDYLTFYRFKQSQKKVSFMPLENSLVQITNEKKFLFSVKDKFNSIIFKTSSKEDMFSWFIAINQAIKIRNSQIYMNDMEQRLNKAMKTKLNNYINKCSNLKDNSKMLPLDDIGRKALKNYFKKNKVPEEDTKMLSIIQTYLYMCKCRRQKGQSYSQEIISQIKASIIETKNQLPKQIQIRDMSSKNQFVKTIQEIMKFLDNKYRREIIEKRNIHSVFQSYMLQQYKQDKKIIVKSLFDEDLPLQK